MTTPTFRLAITRKIRPEPGELYLDRDGRTIEVLAVAAKTSWRPTCITVRVPQQGEEHWSLYAWETLIAVGPLVDVEAVPA